MPTLQQKISRLPFVSGQPGNLNMWDVPTPRDVETDLDRGRWGGATLLHTMRVHDFPGLFYHCNMAWRAAGGKVCDFRQGMELEIGDSILAAPEDHPQLARAAHLQFDKADMKKAVLALPFAYADAAGNVKLDKLNLGGDRSQRVETGKYYGAAVCRLVKETGWTNVLVEETSDDLPAGAAEVLLGVQLVIAEVAMSAPTDCTVYQRAASHFFAPGGPVQPAAPAAVINAI